jgi:predicted DCC family thiol-disulfide oxidoreductase YuxK
VAARGQEADPAAPAGPVILFDGVCNLCDGLVGFIIRRDPRRIFRFAPLQSPAGRHLLLSHRLDSARLDTFVLLDGDRCLTRSDAALSIVKRLEPPWSFLALFGIVPRPLRNWLYGIVARNRYAWFGRRDECLVPSAEVRDRFIPET